jgi:hypothetical protein
VAADIARRNLNSGFDLAQNLAGAKNLAEIVDLLAYWRKQLGALRGPSRGIPCAVNQGDADSAKPIKAHAMVLL